MTKRVQDKNRSRRAFQHTSVFHRVRLRRSQATLPHFTSALQQSCIASRGSGAIGEYGDGDKPYGGRWNSSKKCESPVIGGAFRRRRAFGPRSG